MTEEVAAVQGNTESATDAGVQTEQVATQIDPGVQAAADAATQNPIQAEYNFKYPDGVTPDEKGVEALVGLAKENNIPPELAQKIVDIQANMALSAQQQQKEAQDKARQSWVDNITADKELGGENLKQTLAVANEGLNRVATDEFRKLLQDTGLGDHPDVIRVFHKVGKMLGDDTFVAGGQSRKNGLGMYENSPELK